MTACTSPGFCLLSTERLLKSHQVTGWSPTAYGLVSAVLWRFTTRTPPSPHCPWLWLLRSLLSVPPRSLWLALLLLTAENGGPWGRSPQQLCLNTIPALSVSSVHSQGCICHREDDHQVCTFKPRFSLADPTYTSRSLHLFSNWVS